MQRRHVLGTLLAALLASGCSHDWGTLVGGDAATDDGAARDAGDDSTPDAGDAAVVDACEPRPEECNGIDDDCDGDADEGLSPATYCRDDDGDTYGDPDDTQISCGGAPAGFVEDCTDCLDSDSDVHPGQTAWFTERRGDGTTFDYDCSGREERRFGMAARCEDDASGCTRRAGWASGLVPSCGMEADWVDSAVLSAACIEMPGGCGWDDRLFVREQQECR